MITIQTKSHKWPSWQQACTAACQESGVSPMSDEKMADAKNEHATPRHAAVTCNAAAVLPFRRSESAYRMAWCVTSPVFVLLARK